MKLRPVGDYIALEPEKAKTETPGGIVIPEAAQQKPLRGRVLAVGPGPMLPSGKRVPVGVKVGQRVLYGQYAGVTVELDDGKELLLVREQDILGILEGGS